MRLALVVPALNEEQAIAATLRRALAARELVCQQTPVTHMDVVFVNDGSTDRTQEIVDQPEFSEVIKVRFPRNRGYGAAIKAGWLATQADIVGFIDADGTCDPAFCVPLLNRFFEAKADVVLAGRLNPQSQMPMIRRVGNVIFATLLGALSGHNEITDTASGFRVVRRSSLKLMSPLPDGLHFTPAMSCICLLDPRLRIEEVPMAYKERIGRSKLHVVKDGLRFLYTILFSACCYSPIKILFSVGAVAAVVMAAMVLLLSRMAGAEAALLTATVSGALVAAVLATGVIAHQLNFLLIGPRKRVGPYERALQWLLDHKRLLGWGGLLTIAGLAGLLVTLARQPQSAMGVYLAWSSVILAGVVAIMGGIVCRIIWAVGEKQKAVLADAFAVEPSVRQVAPNIVLPPTVSSALPTGA